MTDFFQLQMALFFSVTLPLAAVIGAAAFFGTSRVVRALREIKPSRPQLRSERPEVLRVEPKTEQERRVLQMQEERETRAQRAADEADAALNRSAALAANDVFGERL